MAITKSAKKAIRGSKRKRVSNLRRKKAMHDVRRDIEKLVATGDKASAIKLLPQAYKAVDKATKRGVLKKNTAARRKSRLARIVSAK